MTKKIAILHTSFVFVSVEPVINDLIAELIPDAEVMHFVDSDVLATVVREEGISQKSEERMTRLAQAAEAAGADIIFSAVTAASSVEAAEQAKSHLAPQQFFLDINSVSPGRKGEVARMFEGIARYVDVAVMAPVTPAGITMLHGVEGAGPHDATRRGW